MTNLRSPIGEGFSFRPAGPGALVHRALIVEGKEGLDLTDDLATGAVGIKDLIKEAKESATQAIDAVAAVGAVIGLREQARREQRAEEEFQMTEALLAQLLNALARDQQSD